MGAAVTPERILKELSELWVSLGRSEEHGVLRACAMTLVVAADEEEEAAVLGEMLAEIMHEHPSRAIVLRVRDGNDAALDSRVLAQCWMPFGRRQQICCEQIEIHASEGSLVDVPRIVHGLMAPDLPVVLVCRSPHLFGLWGFQPLLSIADRVIVDSRKSPIPEGMMHHMTNLRTVGHLIHDLAWTALTTWRETIAHVFDEGQLLARLPKVNHVKLTHAERGPTSETWYLAAWLMRGLKPEVELELTAGTGEEAIQGVELRGETCAILFRRGAGHIIHEFRDGIANAVPFAVSSDWDLLREELSLVGRDRVYEEVLPIAIALAGGRR